MVPFVEDRRNCLIIEPAARLDPAIMASLQAALKKAIQAVYQLEDNEIAAEPLPSEKERRQILLYESAEGGAGVLRRIIEDPQSLAAIADEALRVCHFDPAIGEDKRRASGATEDSTLGYLLGARGILMAPMPLVELVDLPETTEKMIRQNARWYRGVLDDIPVLWRLWCAAPTAFNAAQLLRHVGNKVVEWPVAAVVYPAVGFLGWHLAYRFGDQPVLFVLGVALPSISLGLSIWVGGIETHRAVRVLQPFAPRPVAVEWRTLGAQLQGVFRCQGYWLLATRAAWQVLWQLARTGRYEPIKTDRVLRGAA